MPQTKVDDPIEFLQRYGLDLVDTSQADEKKCVCPFHEDSSPSCGVNVQKQCFKCPVCEAKGDLIDLAAGNMKVKRATIVAHLEQLQGDNETDPIDGGLISSWHNILMSNAKDLELLKTRKGITPKTCKEYLIGRDDDRFTIPVQGRTGSYINVRKWSPTDTRRKVINLRGRGRRQLFPLVALEKDVVVLTEGEFKALLLRQLGFNGLSPTGGASTWSPNWNHEFKDKVVYIVYDVDDAGRRGAQKVARSLHGIAKEVRVVDLPIDRNEFPRGDVTDFVVHLNMGATEIQAALDASEVWRPDPLTQVYDDDDNVYDAPLHETSRAEYYHKFVKTQAVVSAKDTAPFIIPKKAKITCTRDTNFCGLCPVLNQPGEEVTLEVPPKHPAILSLVNISVEGMAVGLKAVAAIPRRCDVVRFQITETQNVEEVRLVPEIRIKNDKEDEKHVVRRAFYVGHGLDPNTSYLFQARVVPEPKTQYATLLAYDAQASVDSLSAFRLEDPDELRIFQPSTWTKEGLERKLADLYEDLEANVTRIYQRRDLHLFYDLVYHSVLYVPFQGRRVKGWMEGLVIGDSGQGKSETLSNLMRHYQLGEKIDSKGATVAGILGGMQESQKRWFVSWGIVPLNDRRLVALEEVKGMSTAVIEKLTDMRSSGIAELAKIEKARTNCRTRMIWVSNPRSDMQLAAYNFGIFAVKELIGALEDVRRFDAVIAVASGDVPRDVLNMRDKDRPQAQPRHTSDLCRKMILWAWSRAPQQVHFEPDAVEAILSAAESMGKKFVSNVPIVEAADQRLKLARASCALAARTASFSDPTGEGLLVRKCHAEYIHEYFDRIYSSPSLGYSDYSNLIRGENSIKDSEEVAAMVKGLSNAKDAVASMLDWQGFSVMDWMDITEHDKDDAKDHIGLLVRKNAIKRGRGGLYYKTPPFISLLRDIQKQDGLANVSRRDQLKKEEF